MPNTNRGYPYETGADEPGHSLTGGSEGSALILAQVLDTDIQAIDNRVTAAEGDASALDTRVTTAENDIAALDGRMDTAETGITANANDLAAHEAATTSVHGIADTAALVTTDDPRLSNAREPTAHAATHATAGTDPIAPADIGAYPATGGTLNGDLTLTGNDATIARADGTAGVRTRVSDTAAGSAEVDYVGDITVSHWSGNDFTGTQTSRQRWHAAGTAFTGVVSFSDSLFTAVNSIDPVAGTAVLGGKNDAEPIVLCGRLTTSGAPAAGTWDAGDAVIDADGVWHLCTVAGTPGTWT